MRWLGQRRLYCAAFLHLKFLELVSPTSGHVCFLVTETWAVFSPGEWWYLDWQSLFLCRDVPLRVTRLRSWCSCGLAWMLALALLSVWSVDCRVSCAPLAPFTSILFWHSRARAAYSPSLSPRPHPSTLPVLVVRFAHNACTRHEFNTIQVPIVWNLCLGQLYWPLLRGVSVWVMLLWCSQSKWFFLHPSQNIGVKTSDTIFRYSPSICCLSSWLVCC